MKMVFTMREKKRQNNYMHQRSVAKTQIFRGMAYDLCNVRFAWVLR